MREGGREGGRTKEHLFQHLPPLLGAPMTCSARTRLYEAKAAGGGGACERGDALAWREGSGWMAGLAGSGVVATGRLLFTVIK